MIYFLITIFSLFFLWLSWYKMNWAVALTIFAMPAYLLRFKIAFLPMTILEVMVLILFIVWLVKVLQKKEKITLSNYKWWGLFFLLTATIAVFVSVDLFASLGVWKAYFLEPIMFFVVFINTIKKKEDWKLVIGALGASALFVAVPAIVQKFTGLGIANEFWRAEETRRVTSWYGFPNAVGLYLAPIAMLFGGLIMQSKIRIFEKLKEGKFKIKKLDVFYFVVFICSALAIYFAKSEGAIIGLIAGFLFLGLIYPYKLSRISTASLVVVLILIGLFVPAVKDYTSEKFTLSDRSGQIRQQQWKETGEMLDNGRMLLGAGLSSYQVVVESYHKEAIWIKDKADAEWLNKIQTSEAFRKKMWQPLEIYMYPHNIILNFWSEIGLLGVFAVVVLLLKLLMNYWRVKSSENRNMYLILLAVFAVVLVHGIVDVPYFKNDLSLLWWLFFCMSWVLVKRKKILYD